MIPAASLKVWLSDRQAQSRTLDRVDAAGVRWKEGLLAIFEQDLATLDGCSPFDYLDAARRLFDRTGNFEALFGDLIAECRADPFFRPPFNPIGTEVHSSLLLHHDDALSVSIGLTGVDMLAAKKLARSGGASINFTGYVALLRFVKAGDALISFWEAPAITDDFVAEDAGQCRLVDRRRIGDGEEIVIDGRYQSFVLEHARSDILFFQAVARAHSAPVAVEYDSDSHHFIGASSTDEASSRLQMMVSLLRGMDCEEAMPLFEEALGSPHFYTRWHVMREILALDAEAALPSLRRLAKSDPHSEVRAAAAQTLSVVFSEEADGFGIGEEMCRA